MLTARLRLLWLAALAAAAVAPLRSGLSAAPGLAFARETGSPEALAALQREKPAAAHTNPSEDIGKPIVEAPAVPAKTVETTKPAEAVNLAETSQAAAAVTETSAEGAKPVEAAKPAAMKPAEPANPAAAKPAEPAIPAVTKPAEPAKPAVTKPAEPVKPAATKPTEQTKPADTKPTEQTKPAATKSTEQAKPAATKPTEQAKPAATKPTEQAKPAATKPAEPSKPATTKPAEPAKPAATKPAEPVKPAATKPAEQTKPADAKPAEPAKPAATKPAEPAKPAATKPAAQTKPAAAKPAEQAKPAATKPSEPAKPAATKPAEPAKPAATKPAEPAKPAATKSAEPAKPAAKKPAEPAKPAATKPAEPVKPAATKPAEPAKPAATKPADPSKPAATKGPSQTASSNDAKVVKREVPAPATPALAERPARILAVIPYNSHSHNVMYAPLFRALALRGHTVHVLSHFPAENPPATYRDLSIKGSYESWVDNVDMDLIASYANPLSVATLLWAETLDVCSKAMEHPATRKLLESDERYDLVVSEVFGAECMAGFAHKFRAPLVGLISSVAPPGALDRMGNPDHPAYTANYFLPYTERMTFWQRLANSFHGWAVRRLKYLLCDRPTDALARRYFGPDLPSTTELVQNTSLILVNTHYSINQPRPMVPGVVEVGGLHIGEPKPLPEELERYVSEAEAGVVVFSLGTMVRVSTWADERLRALWGALGALPQRVIIKSRDPLPSAPPNVRVERWLPQFDLLNHPKVVAFVTHGGLMGTQEAVWAGVPLLGVPMFCDQHLNLNSYAEKGVAIVLQYDELSQERLSDALHRLIEDPRYRERMGALSRQFRDRPRAALESAVWWVEYVARHGGAAHLRSAAADLPLYQYLLLDVVALALLAVGLVVGFVWFLLATVYRFLRFGQGYRRRRLPSVTATGQRKRYTKTKQH